MDYRNKVLLDFLLDFLFVCLFVCLFFRKLVKLKPLLIGKLNHTFISKEKFRSNRFSSEFRKLMDLIVTNSAAIYPDVLPALY